MRKRRPRLGRACAFVAVSSALVIGCGRSSSAPVPRGGPPDGSQSTAIQTDQEIVSFQGKLVEVRLLLRGGKVFFQARPVDSGRYDQPEEMQVTPSAPSTSRSLGFPDVTAYIILLGHNAKIQNADDLAAVTVGIRECGQVTCAVFEVPRDPGSSRMAVEISDGKNISKVELKSRPVGEGGLQFEAGG